MRFLAELLLQKPTIGERFDFRIFMVSFEFHIGNTFVPVAVPETKLLILINFP